MNVTVGTVSGGSVFLLFGLPPGQCIPVPDIGGALIAPPPGVAILMVPTSQGILWVSQGPGASVPCAHRIVGAPVTLPSALPSGSQFLLQALAQDYGGGWSFSNAVQITVQ